MTTSGRWKNPGREVQVQAQQRKVEHAVVPVRRAGPGRPPGRKNHALAISAAAGGGNSGGKFIGIIGEDGRAGLTFNVPIGMGEVAAAAQAARRDRRVDTVVLAKCRRKSQTMWPARLCSKREVLTERGGEEECVREKRGQSLSV